MKKKQNRKFLLVILIVLIGIIALVYSTKKNVLFSDDFSSGMSKWTMIAGTWKIEDGELAHKYSQTCCQFIVAGSSDWTDYTAEVKGKFVEENRNMSSEALGLAFRVHDGYHLYLLDLKREGSALQLFRKVGNYSLIKATKIDFKIEQNVWYKLKVELKGPNIKCYLNDKLMIEVNDTTYLDGKIGLKSSNTYSHWDDVVVYKN
jgi:hypothetical protein